MLGTDIRDLNWQQLRDRIEGLRATVFSALQLFGPCTTRQLAAKMEVDLLSVRPRVTELVELGFAECIRREAGEGVYRALSYTEAHQRFHDRQALARGEGIQTSFL
jgi:hypothetical protein